MRSSRAASLSSPGFFASPQGFETNTEELKQNSWTVECCYSYAGLLKWGCPKLIQTWLVSTGMRQWFGVAILQEPPLFAKLEQHRLALQRSKCWLMYVDVLPPVLQWWSFVDNYILEGSRHYSIATGWLVSRNDESRKTRNYIRGSASLCLWLKREKYNGKITGTLKKWTLYPPLNHAKPT